MVDIKDKVIKILNEVTDTEYEELFPKGAQEDEKLQMLTSESMIALIFVTSLEDEFCIEFNDDEVDLTFFSSISSVVDKIENHLLS